MIKSIDYLYFIAVGVLTLAGQISIKHALNRFGPIPDATNEKAIYLFKALLNPWVILGFVLAFLAALCWLAVISKFDLSYAYPYMVACITLITVFGAALFLREPLTILQVMGVGLIVSGVVVMSL
jgi:multidrug transporter EmrE-like cation transporter